MRQKTVGFKFAVGEILLPIAYSLLPLLERFDGGMLFQKSGARMKVDVFDSHGTNSQIKADAFLRRPVKLDV